MIQTICAICLILAATSMASDDAVPVIAEESRSFEFAPTPRQDRAESVFPLDEGAPSRASKQTDETYEQDRRKIGPEVDEAASATELEPITLDELLRQIRETPHLEREALLARLAERRRLAIALRTTLEAAEQVAAFGQAGAELLQDASLDSVVATMIEVQEQEKRSAESETEPSSSSPRIDIRSVSDESSQEQDTESMSAFDAWRPVYIVRDARGQRIGWRHLKRDERAVTYVGEPWYVGDDKVTVEAVTIDQRGRYLVVDVNGERREVHLF